MIPRPARRVASLQRTRIRRIFDEAPGDAINLGLGQPDLPTPAAICLAGVAGIARGRTAYTTTAGDPELRERIASAYPGFATGAGSVVVQVGSQEALFCSVMALADPGDEVLVPDPGYPAYAGVVRLAGATPIAYGLSAARGFRLDIADVEPRLTDRTRAVVLCSPGNPTGAIHRAEDVRRVCALLERRGIAWISDEIYSAFCYVGTVTSPARYSRGGVVVSGLSKSLSMTGWRIGWAVTDPSLAERISAVHQHLVTCAPSISQAAALAAFDERGRSDERRVLEVFRRRRERMARELARVPGIRWEPPDGAFYFFVRIDGLEDSDALSRRILERERVITIPGSAFGPGGEGHLRLSFAASEGDIVTGVRAIARVLSA